ncbi:MAG: acetate/propionate family kinase [Planctomycetota bacterium]
MNDQRPDDARLLLTLNAGSSSIKFSKFVASDPPQRVLEGSIDRIGLPGSRLRTSGGTKDDETVEPVAVADQAAAARLLMEWLDASTKPETLSAIGHRVVHGGPAYHRPHRVTRALLDELRQLSPFDPEHLPAEIRLMEALAGRFPAIPQVACFDTAFHHDLPRVAQLLPIPRRYERQGVRRYGFHGLSYAFVMDELRRVTDGETANGRIVLAHLGNGASLAAVKEGKPIDTTMSFTPTAGVPMGTRSGDLDPGLVAYVAATEGMNSAQFHAMASGQSGLLGVSETTSDMRDLIERQQDDRRAAEAVALFCYEVSKRIGGFAAALGGLDTVVFSGGIGENSPIVRRRVLERLGFLGVRLDPARNSGSEPLISAADSRVQVRVIRTNEELMIARQTLGVLSGG